MFMGKLVFFFLEDTTFDIIKKPFSVIYTDNGQLYSIFYVVLFVYWPLLFLSLPIKHHVRDFGVQCFEV